MKMYLAIGAVVLSFLFLILKSRQWKSVSDKQLYKQDLASQANDYQYSAEDIQEMVNERFPVNQSLKRVTYFFGIAALLLIAITFVTPSPPQTSGSSGSSSDIFEDRPQLKAKTRVKNFLKNALNDPESYDNVKWYQLVKYDASSMYSYSITHRFRSKNAFGGVITSEWEFFFDSNMNILSIKDATTGEVIK